MVQIIRVILLANAIAIRILGLCAIIRANPDPSGINFLAKEVRRDMPERYGPYTTAYNRFNRWRKAGVWDRLIDKIIKSYDGKIQMIDSTSFRVHQQAAAIKRGIDTFLLVEVVED